MDGLGSAAPAVEEAPPAWGTPQGRPPLSPVVAASAAMPRGGSADAAPLDLVLINPRGMPSRRSEGAQLRRGGRAQRGQGHRGFEFRANTRAAGGEVAPRARGPLAPEMPPEGGTSQGDTRARLSSQKRPKLLFHLRPAGERRGCRKPRDGARPGGGQGTVPTQHLPAPGIRRFPTKPSAKERPRAGGVGHWAGPAAAPRGGQR